MAQEGARQADARQTALDVNNKRQAAKARAAPGDRAIHKVTRDLSTPEVRSIEKVQPDRPAHDPYGKRPRSDVRDAHDWAETKRGAEQRRTDKRPHCNKRPDRSTRGSGGGKGWRPWC